MVDRVITTEEREPRDTVVIKEHDHDEPGRNNGLIIAAVIIIAIIILFLLVGRGFGGRSGGTTNINVPTTKSTTTQ